MSKISTLDHFLDLFAQDPSLAWLSEDILCLPPTTPPGSGGLDWGSTPTELWGTGFSGPSLPSLLPETPPLPPPTTATAPPPTGRGLFALYYSPRDGLLHRRTRAQDQTLFWRRLQEMRDEDPSLIRICLRDRVDDVDQMRRQLEVLLRGWLANAPRRGYSYQLVAGADLDRLRWLVRHRLAGGRELY